MGTIFLVYNICMYINFNKCSVGLLATVAYSQLLLLLQLEKWFPLWGERAHS